MRRDIEEIHGECEEDIYFDSDNEPGVILG